MSDSGSGGVEERLQVGCFAVPFTSRKTTVPPLVYAPEPEEPVRENCVASTTVTTHAPLAAVFPSTLTMTTDAPEARPCAVPVWMTIGDAFVAAVTLPPATESAV